MPPTSEDPVLRAAHRAREAAHELALATRSAKDAALTAMASALVDRRAEILEANGADLTAAADSGTPPALLDRLRLDGSRIEAMAAGLHEVAGLPDPVGEVVR